ncbi:hypothetical protein R3W88_007057 [Solanum pinnatisectum]|uniref:Uncharacterized protein n=1 Tax=Solanum pinnatisectum TaxID=50273 RepID=A0AAV9KGZ8_9SOLN|nr:hypothetical protein R3W88_007057 [Solanum pinnatisectum]
MSTSHFILSLFVLISFINVCFASRKLTALVEQTQLLQYHKGALLSGKISVNLIWYGKFKPSQRAIVSDFITFLSSSTPSKTNPSVAQWWKTTEKYYHLANSKNTFSLSLGKQVLIENYSLGKSLTQKQIVQLAPKGEQKDAINVVLTASDVAVDGFCVNRCGSGTHGASKGACLAAAPAHSPSPISDHRPPPLGAPNKRCGVDGMVINLAIRSCICLPPAISWRLLWDKLQVQATMHMVQM